MTDDRLGRFCFSFFGDKRLEMGDYMKRIILASASPRRKELLEQVGLSFEIIPSTNEEICHETEPAQVVEALAEQKAESVAKNLSGNYIVIGSDTVVAKDNKILGKPHDEAQAFEMLQSLQGTSHEVYSGVALLRFEQDKMTREVFSVKTEVKVFPMSEEQILGYIATGDCMDKAGAYGIQGCFAEYIEGIVGDYYNVVGLPVSRVIQRLRAWL